MWVTKHLISPVKKRIFCPKTTKFGPKLAFFVNLGQAMQAYLVPCWWIVWWLWRAGCIAQDIYLLYYINIAKDTTNLRRGVLKNHLTASKIHSTSFRIIPRKSENVLWDRDGRGSYFFHGEGQGQKSTGRAGEAV